MAKQKETLNFFISYSHEDAKFKKNLLTHLKSIEVTHDVEVWNDGEILPGGDIDKEVLKNLITSNIILLLISPNFLASRYCTSKELIKAMERYENGECIIVPVIIKETIIDEDLPFSRLLRVPDDGKPIQKFRPQNDGYINAVTNIKRLIDAKYSSSRKTSVKEPISPISFNLYQNGELMPYVIDDNTWKAILSVKERLHIFEKIMTEKLMDITIEYEKEFVHLNEDRDLRKFRINKFKSFLLEISAATREWIFKDVGVRVHFRILSRNQYIGYVAIDGIVKKDIRANWANRITPMSTTSGMIYYSGELNAPLIKSKNMEYHDAGKNDSKYIDYITYALKFKDICTTPNPLMSFGISIEKEYNKKYSSYLIALIFLGFDVIVENFIILLCRKIKQFDNEFDLKNII